MEGRRRRASNACFRTERERGPQGGRVDPSLPLKSAVLCRQAECFDDLLVVGVSQRFYRRMGQPRCARLTFLCLKFEHRVFIVERVVNDEQWIERHRRFDETPRLLSQSWQGEVTKPVRLCGQSLKLQSIQVNCGIHDGLIGEKQKVDQLSYQSSVLL